MDLQEQFKRLQRGESVISEESTDMSLSSVLSLSGEDVSAQRKLEEQIKKEKDMYSDDIGNNVSD